MNIMPRRLSLPLLLQALLWLSLCCTSTWAMIEFDPAVTKVMINVGSNLDPAVPEVDDGSTVAIAIEPIVGCRIKHRKNLHVIHAAVSDSTSLNMMAVYNTNGVSSALTAPSEKAFWNKELQNSKVVPVLSMATVLGSIPTSVEIWFLKTDMQGHDYRSVVAAGPELRRVHYIRMETWFGNIRTYQGVENDFCLQVLPFMKEAGFELIFPYADHRYPGESASLEAVDMYCKKTHDDPPTAGLAEADAFFRRNDTQLSPPNWFYVAVI